MYVQPRWEGSNVHGLTSWLHAFEDRPSAVAINQFFFFFFSYSEESLVPAFWWDCANLKTHEKYGQQARVHSTIWLKSWRLVCSSQFSSSALSEGNLTLLQFQVWYNNGQSQTNHDNSIIFSWVTIISSVIGMLRWEIYLTIHFHNHFHDGHATSSQIKRHNWALHGVWEEEADVSMLSRSFLGETAKQQSKIHLLLAS